MEAAGKQEGLRLFVYALCEPDGKTVRYIGLSADLYKRFKAHVSHSCMPTVRAWINALRERGLIPSMVVLREVVGMEAGIAAEAEEIRSHASDQLLNERETGRGLTKQRRGLIEFSGKRMTLSQWAEYLGISRQALNLRIQRHPMEVALSRGKDSSSRLQPGATFVPQYDPGSESIAVSVEAAAKTGLTHPERRERRKQMAAALLRGVRREEVAVHFGVTTATVDLARSEFLGTSALRRKMEKELQGQDAVA
jgi:predicted GIY-YIG superfamily endonuclease